MVCSWSDTVVTNHMEKPAVPPSSGRWKVEDLEMVGSLRMLEHLKQLCL